jgi:hypothetical protein
MNIKRIELSGRGRKILWTIVNSLDEPVFKTKTPGGFEAWPRKKDAKLVLDSIVEYGVEATKERFIK